MSLKSKSQSYPKCWSLMVFRHTQPHAAFYYITLKYYYHYHWLFSRFLLSIHRLQNRLTYCILKSGCWRFKVDVLLLTGMITFWVHSDLFLSTGIKADYRLQSVTILNRRHFNRQENIREKNSLLRYFWLQKELKEDCLSVHNECVLHIICLILCNFLPIKELILQKHTL